MISEEKELQALKLIEELSTIKFRTCVRVTCGVVLHAGRLVAVEEFRRQQAAIAPANVARSTVIHLVCSADEECRKGNYPVTSQGNRQNALPNEPCCGCHYRLKQQYDILPDCVEQYAKIAKDSEYSPNDRTV